MNQPKNYSLNAPEASLHYATSSDVDSSVLIAVNPQYVKESGREYVSWHDPFNHRVFEILRLINDTDDILAWKSDDGATLTLQPMTLAIYNSKVKWHIPGARDFNTQSALERWFTEGIWDEIYGVG